MSQLHNKRRMLCLLVPLSLSYCICGCVCGCVREGFRGDAEGWHRAPIEWVAYELSIMLGMDYVPPVALRGEVELDGRKYDEGAFMHYVPDAKPVNSLSKEQLEEAGVNMEELLSDTRILDVLLQNSDRHSGHFLWGKHWIKEEPSLALIDHAAGFRKEAYVSMEHDNAFQTGPVKKISAKTYMRLRFLDTALLAEKFATTLSRTELRLLAERRDSILSYFDNLVSQQGFSKTVIEI